MIARHVGTIVGRVQCDRPRRGKKSSMTQTTSRFFDELAKLMTDAAGAAQGVRSEVETVIRGQAERILNELDIVQREEFEAVKAMAQKAREQNDRLEERLSVLEARIDGARPDGPVARERPRPPRPVRRAKPKPRY